MVPLTPDLAPSIAALHKRCFPKPWSTSDFLRFAHAAHCHGLIAAGKDGMAGFIVISVAGKDAEILTLAVDTVWRRCGMGTALIGEALAAAARTGAEALLLEVGVSNDAARRLYERNGFTEIGRRRDYYRTAEGPEDALVMRRQIGLCAVQDGA